MKNSLKKLYQSITKEAQERTEGIIKIKQPRDNWIYKTQDEDQKQKQKQKQTQTQTHTTQQRKQKDKQHGHHHETLGLSHVLSKGK